VKTTFGQYIRSLREARSLGLRQFARDVGMQPSNYSNMENGFLQAPSDAALKRICAALGLAEGAAEQTKLFDLAAQSRKEIPVDIREFIKQNPLVPAMLRSMKDKKLSRSQIDALLDDIDKLPTEGNLTGNGCICNNRVVDRIAGRPAQRHTPRSRKSPEGFLSIAAFTRG